MLELATLRKETHAALCLGCGTQTSLEHLARVLSDAVVIIQIAAQISQVRPHSLARKMRYQKR